MYDIVAYGEDDFIIRRIAALSIGASKDTSDPLQLIGNDLYHKTLELIVRAMVRSGLPDRYNYKIPWLADRKLLL